MENLEELVKLRKEAEEIIKDELKKENIAYDFLEVRIHNFKTVGVMGDRRTYEYPIEITLSYKNNFIWNPDLLKKLSNRIINDVWGVNRVLYTIQKRTNDP